MTGPVALVTDSTAMVDALPARSRWRVVPLELEIGDDRYREGPELSAGEFHRILQEINIVPVTLPPPVEAFVEIYRPLLQDGGRILSIHISGELSRTVEHAREAVARLEAADRVIVLDSRLAGAALGLLCLEAEARLASGEGLQETVRSLEAVRDATHVWFSVYTLDFLYLGGRLERAPRDRASHGDRPILTLERGILELVERVEGETTRVDRMVELVEDAYPGVELVIACIHSGRRGQEAAARLEERLRARSAPVSLHHAPLGPVLCAHTGFDVCGIGVYPRPLSALDPRSGDGSARGAQPDVEAE